MGLRNTMGVTILLAQNVERNGAGSAEANILITILSLGTFSAVQGPKVKM